MENSMPEKICPEKISASKNSKGWQFLAASV
jgi:hypothetical protein